MRALSSPNALKGVLTAQAAAAALARGLRSAGVEAEELPVADGGDGTADVLAGVLGGEWYTARVSDPLGRPVDARWLLLPERVAVVESAEAIGLKLLAEGELDPLRASSRGDSHPRSWTTPFARSRAPSARCRSSGSVSATNCSAAPSARPRTSSSSAIAAETSR